ncbi:MAG: glycosyltransferase family 4 protein [Actinobacteria bacterium]|nr:glycosyltransferase family 4 protein [Actinomycetota bacterium]
MLAPPWIPVPPPGYGGIEQVVELLVAELVQRGHEVTLFAAPGSESTATVEAMLERTHPDAIQIAIFESDHAARGFDQIDAAAADGSPFDVVHDHSGFTAFAFANRLETPLVHTLHGPFTDDTRSFYERHADKACAIALSDYQRQQAPDNLQVVAVVPNPIVVDAFPFQADKEDYLLWIGRLNDEKGPHRAIAAARQADRRLLLAGPVQPGEEEFFNSEVKPHIDDDQIKYIGEVGDEKKKLYASAAALLMPIRWPEPFGLVMTEAMACGTPVIAYPEGAAPEIVLDGQTGFVVDSESEMADAIKRLDEIDPAHCRQSAEERFDVAAVAAAHENAYRDAMDKNDGNTA